MEVVVYHLPDNLYHLLPSAFLVYYCVLSLGSATPAVHPQEGSYHQDNEDDLENSLQVRHMSQVPRLWFLALLPRSQDFRTWETTSRFFRNRAGP